MSTTDETFTVDEHTVDGRDGTITVRDYNPERRTVSTPFLWIHGGGFSSGGLNQKESDAPARALASQGVLVRTLDYRLAPKVNPWKDPDLSPHAGRFPAALHDVVDAATSLAGGGPVSVGGASAGANLAAAATLQLRDEGKAVPTSVVLAYGTFHAVLPASDQIEGELRGPLAKWAFNPQMLRRMNLNYVGDAELLTPGLAFPGGANLHGFPPALLLDSRNDRLRRSGHAFAEELRQSGSQITEIVIDAGHAYFNSPRSKGFAHGLSEMGAWLRSHDSVGQ